METQKQEATEPIQPGTQAGESTPAQSQPPSGEQASAPAGGRDPYEQTLQYDQVPREVWNYVQRGVEAGEVPAETLRGWQKAARERQARSFQAHRDLTEMRRALREQPSGSQPSEAVTGGTPDPQPKAASLRTVLGEDASVLGEEAVDALETYVQERVRDAVEPLRQRLPQESPPVDQALQAAQEARDGLRERFPWVADDAVWSGVLDRAAALKESDPRYRFGDPKEAGMRALQDAAHLEMLDHFGSGYMNAPPPPATPSESTVPPQTVSSPAPAASPPAAVASGGISANGVDRSPPPEMSRDDREIYATQLTMRDMRSGRTPDVARNRKIAGLD